MIANWRYDRPSIARPFPKMLVAGKRLVIAAGPRGYLSHSRCFDLGFVVSAFSCKRPQTDGAIAIRHCSASSREISLLLKELCAVRVFMKQQRPRASSRTIFYIPPVSKLPSTLLSTNNLRRFRFYSASDRVKWHDSSGMRKRGFREISS